jgi:hypothetical protein
MNPELKQLIEFVRDNKSHTVEEAVQMFFDGIVWSLLKDEFSKMSKREKAALYRKLEADRK